MIRINLEKAKKAIKKKAGKNIEAERMDATEELIRQRLYLRHKDREWLFFPEFIVSTQSKESKTTADSRLDAWAFNIWPSRNYERVTYEIKIHRDDFTRELRKPDKRLPGLKVSNRFYYVMPAGMCNVDEIPRECGLITCKLARSGKYHILRTVKKAPWRDIPDPAIDFWASLARRINIEEALYPKDMYNRKVIEQYEQTKAANKSSRKNKSKARKKKTPKAD